MAAAAAAAKAAATRAEAPATAFALEKQMRALRGRADALASYLRDTVTAQRIPQLYAKGGLEPDTAFALLQGVAAVVSSDVAPLPPAQVLEWMEAVAATKRFSMTAMLFTRAQKADFAALLQQIRDGADAPTAARAQAVAKAFLLS